MADSRIQKLASILVHYSLEVKAGQQLAIMTTPLAEELTLAVYTEAIKTGAHVTTLIHVPGAREALLKHGNEAQLTRVPPDLKVVVETFDALLSIGAEYNTRSMNGVSPERMALAHSSQGPLLETLGQRFANKEFNWAFTVFPTQAAAQEADMSLADYCEFVYGAGLLNEADPVSLWKAEGERQKRLIEWLAGKDHVTLKGSNIDLTLSIAGRNFLEANGRANFPDGEIYTSPVEDSVNGWVRFRYPAIYAGQEVVDIELWFENGKVVKEKAAKGQELLTSLLNQYEGARVLGELGIGTNYGIQRFTKHILFDEKLGGTIHLAVGRGFPEAGGKNHSSLHWDMLCDMAESEITVDGALFYKNGKPVI